MNKFCLDDHRPSDFDAFNDSGYNFAVLHHNPMPAHGGPLKSVDLKSMFSIIRKYSW